MKTELLSYSFEQLLEEKSFIAWVVKQENHKAWNEFLESNPGFRVKAKKAREIIHLLQDRYDVLDENSVLETWKNIEQYEQQYKQKVRKLKFSRRLSWAASVLLVVSLGTFGTLYLNQKDQGYKFTSSETPQSSEARMVLSTGEEIALKKDNSTIALNDAASQVTVNDSIIDLTQKTDAGKQELRMNEVVIPFGKKSELWLADGTKVWLNAGSRLAFPTQFTGKKREVFLDGEACFKVAENKNQPFVVNAGGLDVKVLGTWFDVSAYHEDEQIETVLLEGSVSIKKSTALQIIQKETILKPLERASFNKNLGKMEVSHEPDAEMVISWTVGWFQFSGESLNSVLKKLERYYNLEILLPEHFNSSESIAGKLDLKDTPEAVFKALSDVAKISYRISGNKVYIDKKIEEIKR